MRAPLVFLLLLPGLCFQVPPAAAADRAAELAALGEALFFDTDLSRGRSQACATCHDPGRAFTDPRADVAGGAVSLGDDGVSIGTRNTPTITYAASTPAFTRDAEGALGGQFLDGRAATLEAQATQPLVNPVEMAMPDLAAVVARLQEKPFYAERFTALFGKGALDDQDRAVAGLGAALAAYERTPLFSPFDSKYDRSLRGEYTMTKQEELGRVLFFSNQFTNCGLCHKLTPTGGAGETFSNYRYHNIGTPKHPALPSPTDHGLMAAATPPAPVPDPAEDGQFKVPTLRNVAVTAPYLHNGVFRDLKTVILFYNQYNAITQKSRIDPETGQEWAPPERPDTLALEELTFGPALDARRIDALVAFLKTLTDQRYEHLLAE